MKHTLNYKKCLIFFSVLNLALFCPWPVLSAQNTWQLIDEGLAVKALQFNGAPYQAPFKLRALRIDLDKFLIRVIDCRTLGVDRMEVKTLAKRLQALAAINGGFFQPDYRPLGLLIMDGQELNPLRKTDWGIFMIQDMWPRIIHTKEFQNNAGISQAIQVGPRLVVAGRELRLKKQIAKRSALGITYKNQIILVNSEDSQVFAQDLAHVFWLSEAEGGLECRDAICLDGGGSAQMFAEYKSLYLDFPGAWPVPNGLGVFTRQLQK